MQNAAIPIIIELIQRIDAAEQRNALQRAIAGNDLRGQFLARLQITLQPPYCYGLVALQADRLPRCAVLERQREHAHTDEIGTMDALEALTDHRAHTEQPRSLCRPVT